MTTPTSDQELIPGWRVRIDGRDLDLAVVPDVLSVEVEHHSNGSDAFDITVNAWDVDGQDFQHLDDERFPLGATLEVLVGYGEDMVQLIEGEIGAQSIEYGAEEAPVLHVEGYDKLHRLRRGRRSRSFTQVKDSELAERIARDHQLQAEVEDTRIVHPHLFQYNQSDIDFLQERARRIDYEVDVADGRLVFRRAAFDRAGVESLAYRRDLKRLDLRLSTLAQVSRVVVGGWNVSRKEAVVGSGASGDALSAMGGAELGPVASERVFDAAREVVVDHPVVDQAEADQIAQALFNRISLEYIKGEGESIGNARLRAGDVVDLAGLGQRLSGAYYLTSTHHIIDEDGYRTQFSCRRNATS